MINRDSIKHAYIQVADAVTTRIQAGHYTVRLPSERPLAEDSTRRLRAYISGRG